MSNRLNKQDLAAVLVSKELFSTKKEALEVVETMFESIAEIVESGDSVAIAEFGKFSLYKKLDNTTKPKFAPFDRFKQRCSNG